METKIIKSFGKLTESEINGGGVKGYASWQTLLPYLKHAFHVQPNEYLEGIEVNAEGIKVHVTKKL